MNVLEELVDLESQIDCDHVARRVRDRERRVRDLYDQIIAWLPRNWTRGPDGAASFHEELTRRFGVHERRLPVLRLTNGSLEAKVEPRGLWIIGANGRVDLIRPSSHYLIIDRADNVAPADWRVSSLADRFNEQPISRDRLARMLG